jgi:hypothetical protein
MVEFHDFKLRKSGDLREPEIQVLRARADNAPCPAQFTWARTLHSANTAVDAVPGTSA